MGYASDLEARIAKNATRAIVDFSLVEDGDRIMVGLSGGKDSWSLLQILHVLRRRAPIRFSVVALTVDQGRPEFRAQVLADACADRGWEHHIQRTNISQTIEDVLDPGDSPCSLCAKLRRGVLYRMADELGATKIALGHHADDLIETLLLNILYAGALKAMPARLVSDDGRHVVIRPLAYVDEADTRHYATQCALPVIAGCCAACGDIGQQRPRVKRLIAELEREHPGVRRSMMHALSNVMPRHLLDRRLCNTGSAKTMPDAGDKT
jgi:tRNA 2-thiocytidine biosynthesis protein TtcA